MKKLVSMFLVLVLISTMATSVMAAKPIPGTASAANSYLGYDYTCNASTSLSNINASFSYGNNRSTLRIASTLKRTERSTGITEGYVDSTTGKSNISYYYRDAGYTVTKANIGFYIGSEIVFDPIFMN